MKMADFKALPLEERIAKLNTHLAKIRGLGRLEDTFKSDEFDFSYSLLQKSVKALGIVLDGKNYRVYAAGDEPPVVETQQDIVKSEKVVKQQQVKVKQDVVKPQQTLTTDEIAFIKRLYKDHQSHNNEQQWIVDGKQMLVVPTMVGAKKTTGISVYIEQWERWSVFKAKYNMYSGTDLMAMALDEFMAKYDGDDDK